jgi:hypothetical protein
VSQRDDNNKSRLTTPYQRPLLLLPSKNLPSIQRDAPSDRFWHNHPSGDPTPSQADVKMTKDIIAMGAPLGVVVHDHLIVGRQRHASLKSLKLICLSSPNST